jgi:hypothetical protein
MWVREVRGANGSDVSMTSQRIRRRQRFRSMRPGRAADNLTLPAIDVVVRCGAAAAQPG